MVNFIDRRLNPRDRNLGNRRRFIRRVRSNMTRAVDKAVRDRGIADAGKGETITVPTDGIGEPHFQHSAQGGHRERVLPGNKHFRTGDHILKPSGPTDGNGGREGSPDGEGEDDFAFVLSRNEFLDILFEDLELPDMVKQTLRESPVMRPKRAGLAVTGNPANLSVPRTMRNALGRRLALRRPTDQSVIELRERIDALEALSETDEAAQEELAALRAKLETLLYRQKLVPWLDPLDVRYRYFEQQPEPNAKAVMFCLMDVSASMREREKDLAKRFFILLHLFLTRHYEQVALVFIRHTHRASEVDEETFFHSRETGGTVVSSALTEMKTIIDKRFPPSEWNIYAAQASDGENSKDDSGRCADILTDQLLPLSQYFAYIEIIDERETGFLTDETSGGDLWMAYRKVMTTQPNLAIKRIAAPADIYPVFHELFARRQGKVV